MATPDHVRRLRERIGNELLVLPAVTVLIGDDEGRLVLVRHAQTGRWGLVGGAVEPDERPDEAAVREAEEETGLRVRLTGLVGATGGPEFRVRYANGDEVAYVSVAYTAEVTGGAPRPDGDETVDVAWVAPTDLAHLDLSPFARATLEALRWPSGRAAGAPEASTAP